MMGDYHVRFCERFRGETPLYLLDFLLILEGEAKTIVFSRINLKLIVMSAIAEFRLIEKSKLIELNNAAEIIIKRGFLKSTRIDNYPQFLDTNTSRLKEFNETGYVFGNLLIFLQERGIDLLDNEFGSITNGISEKRKTTNIIFTKQQKDKYYNQLDYKLYSIDELIVFNKEFSDETDPDFAKAELEGIKVLKENFESLSDDNYVILLTII
jgi:hypothetical protein